MSSKTSPRDDPEARRRKRRLGNEIKERLRELSIQLSLLNHQVSARLNLRDVDLDCLDLINRHGPISPGALSRLAGLHPATMTGILDRLERAGWAARDRDPADRRAVIIRPERDRGAEILGLYAGMNTAMDDVCAGYDEDQLTLIGDFLHRAATAGAGATDELTQP